MKAQFTFDDKEAVFTTPIRTLHAMAKRDVVHPRSICDVIDAWCNLDNMERREVLAFLKEMEPKLVREDDVGKKNAEHNRPPSNKAPDPFDSDHQHALKKEGG